MTSHVAVRHRLRIARVLVLLVAAAALVASAPKPADANGAHAQIQGSGSSWAYNSIQQWISDTQSQGLQVVFTPSGSAAGRKDFANGVSDFAVSDIGFQGVNPQTGYDDVSQRPYAYLPVVGGGTAFPYHLTVRGQLVRNLRLSQLTLAKIFTNQITNWDDPAITADNNGVQFPSIPIVPVVHSEGAGTTYQVTDWLSHTFPSLWQGFFHNNYPVEYWPSGGSQQAENGSDGLISFIDSSAGQGSIGYDEYSYALQDILPVVKVENAAGFFTAPDQYNVAVALTQAQINYDQSSPDYLLEDLSHVWGYNDPRTYPLSSYSYFIEPTAASDPTMSTAKRQTIVDYLSYSLCQGQGEMGPIGYSPLPVNLVQASFQQLAKLKAADSQVSLQSINVAQCNNPTFDPANLSLNKLAEVAPQPPACDKAGAGPCSATTGIVVTNPNANGQVPASSSGSGTSTPTGQTPSGTPNNPGAASPGGAGASTAATPAGNASGAGGTSGSSSVSGGSQPSLGAGVETTTTQPPKLVVTNLAASQVGNEGVEVLVAVLIVLVLAAPPAFIRTRQGRHKDPT